MCRYNKSFKIPWWASKEDVKIENLDALKSGLNNLNRHIDNLKNKFGLNVIVAINKFLTDTDSEIELLKKELEDKNIPLSLVESHQKGSAGAQDLANKIIELANQKEDFRYIYQDEDSIKEKIEKVAKNIYGAKNVEYSEEATTEIEKIEKLGYGKFPVCIAKTQYSFSDDPKNLECKDPFILNVNEIILKTGAEFVVAITGKIMTMPGLPKVPAAEKIDLDENGNIMGIF